MKTALFVSVIGAGICDAATYALAEEVGRELAQRGATVVCGGLGGVMEAACRGAKNAGGRTIYSFFTPSLSCVAGEGGGRGWVRSPHSERQ